MTNRAERRPVSRRLGAYGVGYHAMRADDCLRAAIATVTQTPLEQLPDLRLHKQFFAGGDPDEISARAWARIAEWLERRRLRLVVHEGPPIDHERWIGVCAGGDCYDDEWRLSRQQRRRLPRAVQARVNGPNPFPGHCLAMARERIVFDPMAGMTPPAGMKLRGWRLSDVTYGISFAQLEKE